MIDFRWLSNSLCDLLHWQFANPGSEDGPEVPRAGRRLWEIPACDAEVDDCDAETTTRTHVLRSESKPHLCPAYRHGYGGSEGNIVRWGQLWTK
jgi:hypothetical protein